MSCPTRGGVYVVGTGGRAELVPDLKREFAHRSCTCSALCRFPPPIANDLVVPRVVSHDDPFRSEGGIGSALPLSHATQSGRNHSAASDSLCGWGIPLRFPSNRLMAVYSCWLHFRTYLDISSPSTFSQEDRDHTPNFRCLRYRHVDH